MFHSMQLRKIRPATNIGSLVSQHVERVGVIHIHRPRSGQMDLMNSLNVEEAFGM